MMFGTSRMVDKDFFDSLDNVGEFITHTADSMWRDIANQMIHELCVNNECIFKLHPLTQLDRPEVDQYEIRQQIECIKLVRCEKCKYRDSKGYCERLGYFVPCDFFCKNGLEKGTK